MKISRYIVVSFSLVVILGTALWAMAPGGLAGQNERELVSKMNKLDQEMKEITTAIQPIRQAGQNPSAEQTAKINKILTEAQQLRQRHEEFKNTEASNDRKQTFLDLFESIDNEYGQAEGVDVYTQNKKDMKDLRANAVNKVDLKDIIETWENLIAAEETAKDAVARGVGAGAIEDIARDNLDRSINKIKDETSNILQRNFQANWRRNKNLLLNQINAENDFAKLSRDREEIDSMGDFVSVAELTEIKKAFFDRAVAITPEALNIENLNQNLALLDRFLGGPARNQPSAFRTALKESYFSLLREIPDTQDIEQEKKANLTNLVQNFSNIWQEIIQNTMGVNPDEEPKIKDEKDVTYYAKQFAVAKKMNTSVQTLNNMTTIITHFSFLCATYLDILDKLNCYNRTIAANPQEFYDAMVGGQSNDPMAFSLSQHIDIIRFLENNLPNLPGAFRNIKDTITYIITNHFDQPQGFLRRMANLIYEQKATPDNARILYSLQATLTDFDAGNDWLPLKFKEVAEEE